MRAAVTAVVRCGGDTDSTAAIVGGHRRRPSSAAIVGGIVGAAVGKEGIPNNWLQGLWEWPRSVRWMESLSKSLAHHRASESPCPPGLPTFAVLPRNLLFLLIVLAHGFRDCCRRIEMADMFACALARLFTCCPE
jgi:ADP-ribosyl-[dinitrogen reductase] hydrolase